MTASNTGSTSTTHRVTTGSLSRYDLVLLLIPVAFVLALFSARLLPVSLPSAMAAASTVGVFAVADGLFVNPPIRR